MNKDKLAAFGASHSAELLSFMVAGSVGYLFSLMIFSLALYGGVSPVSSHLMAALAGSSLIFCLIYRLWCKSASQPKVDAALLSKLFVAFVTGASTQGALFADLHRLLGFNAYVALAIAAVGNVFIFSLLTIRFVSPSKHDPDRRIHGQSAAATLIAISLLLRIVYLGLPELMEQEAYYWNYSQHLALSYLDHPPMVAVLIWIGTKLFGLSEFGVRIGAFGCWLITAFFSYRLTLRIFGKPAAIGAVLLLATLPVYFGVGFLMTPDAPLHAAWSALIYFLYRALIDGSSRSWLGVGASLGAGLLSKYTIALLCPAILCFLLIDRRARGWLLKPEPYIAALVALILFLPVIIWNFQHDWASFLFQTSKRLSSKNVHATHILLGHITLILTPAGLLAVLMFFVRGNNIYKEKADGQQHAISKNGIERSYLLFLLLMLVPFLVFFFVSFTKEVKLNWTSPVWLAVLPFLGYTATSIYRGFCSICFVGIQGLWRITIPVLTLVFAIALHYVTLGLPGVPFPSGPFLIGWQELAGSVEQLVETIEHGTGKRPIVVGMDHYQIASGLTFYRAKNNSKTSSHKGLNPIDETTGWHLFGFNSRMYRFWSDPAKYQGVDILAIASSKLRLERAFFKSDINFKTDIHPLAATKDGQEVGRLYYRLISAPSADEHNEQKKNTTVSFCQSQSVVAGIH